MESLAYIHMSLEYEKSLQPECNVQQLSRQKQSTITSAKVYHYPNWWQINFLCSQPKHTTAK